MEMFKLFPLFCVLVQVFQAALRIYFTNIKSPDVEVKNVHFSTINFTNIYIRNSSAALISTHYY